MNTKNSQEFKASLDTVGAALRGSPEFGKSMSTFRATT